MSKPLFVAGITSHLHDTIITQYKEKENYRIIATSTDPDTPETDPQDDSLPFYIPWTPHSPLSARAAVVKIENMTQDLDEAVFAIYTEPFSKPFHETTWAAVDQLIDLSIKSTLFMLKEIITLFHQRGNGTLTIVWQIPEISSITPFGKILFQTIRSIVDTLLEIYETYPINIRPFYTYKDETEEFVKYIIDAIHSGRKEKYQRKWIRFTGDRSPLSIFKQ